MNLGFVIKILGAHWVVIVRKSSMRCKRSTFIDRTMSDHLVSRIVLAAHQILLSVINFGMPQEDNQHANKTPTIQNVLQHQIIYQEGHNLGKALKVLPNETPFIFAHILSIEAGRIEPIRIDAAGTHLENVHRG